MDLDTVVAQIDGVPYMRESAGRQVHDVIVEHGLRRILELGTAHGPSTCSFAAPAERLDGHVTTIDKAGVEERDPNLATLLSRTGLTHRVTPVVASSSFTWELMRWLRDRPGERIDFCYLDAGHSWDVTGFAFHLVDQLLNPGGWLLFDDVDWIHDASEGLRGTRKLARMPEDERTTPQVALVLDLLVARHPAYEPVVRDGSWGWVRKRPLTRLERLRHQVRGAQTDQ